jgi:hypothetical protein
VPKALEFHLALIDSQTPEAASGFAEGVTPLRETEKARRFRRAFPHRFRE